MKRILLMRHAKSSWDQPGQIDKERPLNPRGQDAATAMSAWLPEQQLLPQKILHSPAVRTTQTVDILLESWLSLGHAIEREPIDQLYLGPPQAIMETLGQTPENVETVLLVAHNPGLEELIAYIARQYHRFPTAAVADIQFADDWETALTDPRKFVDGCSLKNVWRPKEIFQSAKRDAS